MESQRSIADWRRSVFGQSDRPELLVCRALEEFGELMELLTGDEDGDLSQLKKSASLVTYHCEADDEPAAINAGEVADEMADVLIVLFGAADEWGIDLMRAVDEKMAINREREWDVTGPGMGQHR